MKYILVEWPEIQTLMEYDWFQREAILMNDPEFLNEIGSSAYFIPEDRYNEVSFS